MKKTLLILALVALIYFSYEGYKMVTERMKGPRWDYLLPETKQAVLDVLADAKKEGLDVMFWSGFRTLTQQETNIQQGTSFVTDPLNSYHPWGMAADITFRDAAGLPTWPPASDPRWQKLGAIMERRGLTWGGRWRRFDGAHGQLKGHTIASIRAEYGDDPKAFLADNGVTIA